MMPLLVTMRPTGNVHIKLSIVIAMTKGNAI